MSTSGRAGTPIRPRFLAAGPPLAFDSSGGAGPTFPATSFVGVAPETCGQMGHSLIHFGRVPHPCVLCKGGNHVRINREERGVRPGLSSSLGLSRSCLKNEMAPKIGSHSNPWCTSTLSIFSICPTGHEVKLLRAHSTRGFLRRVSLGRTAPSARFPCSGRAENRRLSPHGPCPPKPKIPTSGNTGQKWGTLCISSLADGQRPTTDDQRRGRSFAPPEKRLRSG